ncbi:unnamed protein product [Vitrella brassicaformis CCMP3155]|uniref:Zinc transporter ZupT n=1 Tax=Vitrella brassicaformis (strain CCMP3155) TaxID=1169540 RepID=A0A0G4GKN0_VITBC|nr:unnamed protein product [Vitrella brassicaformis CCMP3155]|eukprot:CEM30584.1 unnamed protein product [Vitrella brassicaformis CCMP3155]
MATDDRSYLQNEVFAFILTIIAGAATALGSALSFCLPQYNKKVFSVCLSLSAGVMIYVSFLEIFQKSADEFGALHEEGTAYAYATLCFFGGMLIAAALDRLIERVFKWHGPVEPYILNREQQPDQGKADPASRQEAITGAGKPDPASIQGIACEAKPMTVALAMGVVDGASKDKGDGEGRDLDDKAVTDVSKDDATSEQPVEKQWDADRFRLQNLGIFSGCALALHNFPEGIATFASALADPIFGIGVAVAIAIHNVPEGIAVSVPIYYATGSKCKAFWWSVLCGVAEPVGGLLAWVVLANAMTPSAFAILFGLVGGIMIHICFKKLIPTSLRYDPRDVLSSDIVLVGMAVMALSLVLLAFFG